MKIVSESEEKLLQNDLANYLLDYAAKNKIKHYIIPGEPRDISFSYKKNRTIIINSNWYSPKEIPFIIGHEIGHVMLHDGPGINFCDYFNGENSEEKAADNYSLSLIYHYASNADSSFKEPGDFMNAYGIPYRIEDSVKELFKRNNNLSF